MVMTPIIPRSVQDWFLRIIEPRDDLNLTKLILAEFEDDNLWPGGSLSDVPRQLHLLNLITAVRLDQMAKENS
jgi:hypothetical protein